jgi:hypothetical protein
VCTGTKTVTVALPVTFWARALMVATPGCSARTTPYCVTETCVGAELLQVTGTSLRAVPLESRVVAVSVRDAPQRTVSESGLMVTVATAAGGRNGGSQAAAASRRQHQLN